MSDKVHNNTARNTQGSRVAIRKKAINQKSAELINHYSQGSHVIVLSGAICRKTDFYKDDMYLF